MQYILDGGALLHQIPWQKGSTFSNIFESYQEYVLKKYGEAVVVFDGSKIQSTKDLTHSRHKGNSGATVSFTEAMALTTTKEEFLSNKENKQRFVKMLGAELEWFNCPVFHDPADADFLIVQKVVESAENSTTVLIGA